MRIESGCGNFTASDTAIVLDLALKLYLFFPLSIASSHCDGCFSAVCCWCWCWWCSCCCFRNVVRMLKSRAPHNTLWVLSHWRRHCCFAAISRAKQMCVFFCILSACWSKHTPSSWHSTVVTSAHERYFQLKIFVSFVLLFLTVTKSFIFGSNETIFFTKPTISGESGVESFSIGGVFQFCYFLPWSMRRFFGRHSVKNDLQLVAIFFFALLSSCACGF